MRKDFLTGIDFSGENMRGRVHSSGVGDTGGRGTPIFKMASIYDVTILHEITEISKFSAFKFRILYFSNNFNFKFVLKHFLKLKFSFKWLLEDYAIDWER